MNAIKRLCILTATALIATSVGCSTGDNTNSSTDITIVTPRDQKTLVLVNDDVANFIRDNEDFSFFEQKFSDDKFYMSGADFSWNCDIENDGYEVKLSLDPKMAEKICITYSATEPTLHVDDLFVASTYYIKIFATANGKTITSNMQKFNTAPTPRAIAIDGMFNTRDVGGKKLKNGKQIRQNLIFRGSNADEVTAKGKEQIAALGIKTDLDLRAMTEGKSNEISMMGDNIGYYKIESPMYVLGNSTSIDKEANFPAIRSIFEVLTNKDNYPLYMHCQIGRDRTGTISALLLALLGASEEDIVLDYQMSFFSGKAMTDEKATPKLLTDRIHGIIYYLKSLAETEDGEGDLYKGCETYLKNVGITQTQINDIRDFLTE